MSSSGLLSFLSWLLSSLGWLLGIIGFFRARRALRELGALRLTVTALQAAAAAPAPQATADSVTADSVPVPATTAAVAAAPKPAPAPPPPAGASAAAIEAQLTLRWGVWLGGIALLFAAVFLIRYSVEQGWLGPAVRCTLAACFGVVLLAAAGRLRQWGGPRALPPPFRHDQAPPALAGGGVVALFASAYGAGVLYSLVPPLAGFAGMAAAALVGLAVSLRHGPLPAALGVLGAFVTPALIGAATPSLPGLFAYLLAVTAAALTVMRCRAWTWLGWGTAAAGAIWVTLAAGYAGTGDTWAPALFVPAAAALNLLLLPDAAVATTIGRRLAWLPVAALGGAGLLLESSVTGAAPRAGVLLLAPVTVWKAATAPRLRRLPWLAAGLFLAVLLLWALPAWVPTGEPIRVGDVVGAVLPGAWAPAVIQPLLMTAGLMAAGFAAAGLWWERRAADGADWSALVAAVPPLTLAVTYAQVDRFQADALWAFAALALAGGLTVAAGRAAVERARQRAGVHAAGATASVALGCAMLWHDHWLSIALALLLPPLGWIEGAADLPALRRVVIAVAGVVLIRLVLNWDVLDDSFGSRPIVNGLLLTYGLAAASFAWTAKRLRARGDDSAVSVLRAGAVALVTVLVALEIRDWAAGGALRAPGTFLEVALHVTALAVQAAAMAALAAARQATPDASWLTRRTGLGVVQWGWRIEGGLALFGGIGLLAVNPMVADVAVSGAALALGYLIPALLAAITAWRMPNVVRALRQTLGLYAIVAGFAWIGFEIRYLFHGAAIGLSTGVVADAELWAWSGAWLAYGIALMALALIGRAAALRAAALVIIACVAAKVFLFDMADLAGLWRVLSFLGLGLTLIGLGAVYRRFVMPPAAVAALPADGG